ncbi:hypothetical protein MKW98_027273 [Papaver atlanticum]|uniref:Uncharacterized protein n=1 Tax=Papaver atlanticum TaxID=357466 RepID=A0AAD4SQY4_9MAGN|nr:hypothetical protein MKW98_027273 [Papaver atlanticum]
MYSCSKNDIRRAILRQKPQVSPSVLEELEKISEDSSIATRLQKFITFLLSLVPRLPSQFRFTCLLKVNKMEDFLYAINSRWQLGTGTTDSGEEDIFLHHKSELRNKICGNQSAFQISLLYANISPDDILLKQTLDILSASNPNFKICCCGFYWQWI